jgi:ATP-binding cassette, subfamily F, member 3
VFEIGEGKVEIYPGNYEDYLWRKQGGAARQTAALENELVGELSAVRSAANRSAATHSPVNQTSARDLEEESSSPVAPTNGKAPKVESGDSRAKRLNPIKRKRMQGRLREIEEQITRAEAAIALYETQLQSFISAEETQRQTEELAMRKSDLQLLMEEWEELSEALS